MNYTTGVMDVPEDVLCHILGYADKDVFIFLGLVNKAFLFCMEDNLTSYISALRSETRLKSVLESGDLSVDDEMLLEVVAKHDIPHVLPTLMKAGMQWDPFSVEEAGRWESIKFLRYVEETGLFWLPENAYSAACSLGKIDFMKKMVSEGLGFPDYRCIYQAISTDSPEMIEWLTLLMNSDEYRLTLAARDNDLLLFNGLVCGKVELYQRLATEACVNGSIDIIESLETRGIHLTKSDIYFAEYMGREIVTDLDASDDEDFNLI